MNALVRIGRVAAIPAVAATALVASPAFAQSGGGSTPPDLSPISDALVDGLTSGIGLLMVFAPTVVLFSVVWMLVKKAGALGKAG